MKTKFTNSELTHVWANKQQTHGKGSNMFFEHDTIYSYGYHFKIAKHIKNELGQDAVFFNNRSYSNTTNKHQMLVWRSIPANVPFFKVTTFFENIETASRAHKDNLTEYINEAERLQGLTIRATKLKMGYLNQLSNQIDIIEKYSEFFGIDDFEQFNPILNEGLTLQERYNNLNSWITQYWQSNELKQWQEKKKENDRKALEKAKEKAKESIEAFRQFKISSIYANLGHYLLRYNKETENIETSGGVKMPKNIFLAAYQRLINNQLLQGQHVGDYKFNGINGDIVSVGCHKIPMTEIQNIVSFL
jgi:hypothetical protein